MKMIGVGLWNLWQHFKINNVRKIVVLKEAANFAELTAFFVENFKVISNL